MIKLSEYSNKDSKIQCTEADWTTLDQMARERLPGNKRRTIRYIGNFLTEQNNRCAVFEIEGANAGLYAIRV